MLDFDPSTKLYLVKRVFVPEHILERNKVPGKEAKGRRAELSGGAVQAVTTLVVSAHSELESETGCDKEGEGGSQGREENEDTNDGDQKGGSRMDDTPGAQRDSANLVSHWSGHMHVHVRIYMYI